MTSELRILKRKTILFLKTDSYVAEASPHPRYVAEDDHELLILLTAVP